MRKENLHILSSKRIALDTIEMVLENTYISKTAVPGQFLHVSVEGHSLRRPISIADIDKENETITILFKIIGSGTKQLATYHRGMTFDVLGPSGNGFNLENRADSTILLIGGGIGVPPLYYLGKTLANQHIKLISILGYQTAQQVFYEQRFQEIGETHIVTNDGTHGEKGLVTDILNTIDFDRYYACGPVPMLQAITAKLEHQPGFISLEERMGCGVGACFACVIPTDTPDGYKKICKDGPVFNAQEVSL